MGWLEFAVIIGCGLAGFIVISAVIDARRVRAEGQQDNDGATKDDEPGHTQRDQHRRTEDKGSSPRSWWETLNVDENASPEQIKSAFRKEIAKYHPDRVEGLGIELRELAELKAKEVNHAYAVAKTQGRFK
jgi:DnaJ-domain-containing protein 1